MDWNWSDLVEIGDNLFHVPEVAGAPLGQEQQAVEELKGGRRRLVNRSYDDQIMSLCDVRNELHDFVASCRIKSTRWFVKKKYLRRRHKLICDADTALLPTADALPDWRPNNGVLLLAQAESGYE